jgi:cysteinyl-tRNA synthetase
MQAAEEKLKAKEEAKRRQEEKQAAKDAQRRVPPAEMFRRETNKYSQFDEEVSLLSDLEVNLTVKGQWTSRRDYPHIT